MSTRTHTHPTLPAPTLHAGYSSSQSKSHVLAGVQDAYWSDDEVEDAECPLCLEEMDVSDLNFKPCVCGYQICRFCWHHIKENLNGRCPACRREYTEESVQFKAINPEDHKRLTQQKKQRERERKELDALGRRNLANVRVVQRNVVYVTGLGARFAKEELIPTLRSNEYFGQYGKIAKIVITKRTPSGSSAPVIGLYITYHRREDATRCIAVVDGAPAPGGGSEVMRASHGTTKYCMSFLRGVACNDHSCMSLHEWGDEKDCFTKEDLTTLKHTMKDTETRARTVGKKGDEPEGALPRAAAWASKSNVANSAATQAASSTARREARRATESTRPARAAAGSARPGRASQQERKNASHNKTPSQASSSRPSTPAISTLPPRPVTPVTETKSSRQRAPSAARPSSTPAATAATKSREIPAAKPEASSTEPPQSTPPEREPPSVAPSPALAPAVPPGIPTATLGAQATSAAPAAPAVPPGLPGPPGLSAVPQRTEIASPPLTKQPSGSYQMSNQARALLEDVTARRVVAPPPAGPAPFPELDDMLQSLSLSAGDDEFGGFSFNFDPKLADEQDESYGLSSLPEAKPESEIPFRGDFMAAFPALRPSNAQPSPVFAVPPPGLSFNHTPNRSIYDPLPNRPPPSESPSLSSSYSGSFNPFGDGSDGSRVIGRNSMHGATGDDDRKMSRFGFARGRQGTGPPLSSTSSPAHTPAIVNAEMLGPGTTSFYSSDAAPSHPQAPWMGRNDFGLRHDPSSQTSSPMLGHAQAQPPFAPQPTRYQSFDQGVSEAQLRDFIHLSRGRATPASSDRRSNPSPFAHGHNQSFQDPAIMSAGMSPGNLMAPPGLGNEYGFMSPAPQSQNFQNPSLAYGPPPGLSFRQNSTGSPAISSIHGHSGANSTMDPSRVNSTQVSSANSPAPSSPLHLSTSDFPALSVESPSKSPIKTEPSSAIEENVTASPDAEATSAELAAVLKAERKAAKKAAAAERAAERARIAQEKSAARVAEKARLAAEKAAEKEKSMAAKAAAEREDKERLEREKADKARLRADKAEKDRLEREKAERVAEERRIAAEKADEAKKAAPEKQKTVAAAKSSGSTATSKGTPAPPAQVPILSKMPKKNKPTSKPIRIPKEDDIVQDTGSTVPSTAATEAPQLPLARALTVSETIAAGSRSSSVDRVQAEPASLEELLDQIDVTQPWMNLLEHPFFDISKINPAAKMPLEYGPLVHALSALSVGGGSFASNMPSGSIDHAVSSFQQLLETLTQTISDLLRLLPRTTWDDSSSFDGVLRDMLRGDDFLDDAGEDGSARADEVAALTLALERRARWMEVQLSKLEELHRDINTAAVRAVLSFNDRGWDRHGFMPRIGNTLARFDSLGYVKMEGDNMRPMTTDELEKKLVVAKEAAVFAETELRESMELMQGLRSTDDEL